MKKRSASFGLVACLALAGCAGSWATDYEASLDPAVTKTWRVTDVAVTVPENLTTTEENTLAPNADIVWHGEAPGDRKSQVAALIDDAITESALELDGASPVRFEVTVVRFHAVTPAAVARAPQAVHNIAYEISVVDEASGEPVVGPVPIRADLEAYVGAGAIMAAQEGATQKVRIQKHIVETTRGWLGIGQDQRRQFSGLGR